MFFKHLGQKLNEDINYTTLLLALKDNFNLFERIEYMFLTAKGKDSTKVYNKALKRFLKSKKKLEVKANGFAFDMYRALKIIDNYEKERYKENSFSIDEQTTNINIVDSELENLKKCKTSEEILKNLIIDGTKIKFQIKDSKIYNL